MKRREFIGLVGGAGAWPFTASAQRAGGKIVTIGILASEPWPPIETFRRALEDLGYVEGKNVRFEYRYTEGHNERLPELADDWHVRAGTSQDSPRALPSSRRSGCNC